MLKQGESIAKAGIMDTPISNTEMITLMRKVNLKLKSIHIKSVEYM